MKIKHHNVILHFSLNFPVHIFDMHSVGTDICKKDGEVMSYRVTENLSASANSIASKESQSAVNIAASSPALSFKELIVDKLSSIEETTQQMQELRSQLQALKNDQKITEIIRRLMPDGSIMITEYSDGKIVSRYRKKPHMIAVPDETVPAKLAEDGTKLMSQQPMVLKPSRSIASELFY